MNNINAGRVGTSRINAVKAPTVNQNQAAAMRKVKHPEAPHEAAALEDELRMQREELAEMTRLLDQDPEQFDRYFDQVAETGEVKQGETAKVSAKQIPAKKPAPRKASSSGRKSGNPAKRAAAKKAVAKTPPPKALEQSPLAPGQLSAVPIVPVPPPQPGAETIEQVD